MYFLQQHLVFAIWGLMPERTTSDWTECIRIKNIKHFLVKSFYFKVLNTNPWSLIMKECSSKINLWNKENQSRMFVIRLNFPSNTLWKHANTNQWFWVFIYCKSNTQNTTSKGIRPLQTIEYSCEKMRTGKQNPKQNLGQQNRKSLKTLNPGQNTHLVLTQQYLDTFTPVIAKVLTQKSTPVLQFPSRLTRRWMSDISPAEKITR